jgi:hypothetical protein
MKKKFIELAIALKYEDDNHRSLIAEMCMDKKINNLFRKDDYGWWYTDCDDITGEYFVSTPDEDPEYWWNFNMPSTKVLAELIRRGKIEVPELPAWVKVPHLQKNHRAIKKALKWGRTVVSIEEYINQNKYSENYGKKCRLVNRSIRYANGLSFHYIPVEECLE